jgi:hypothetical protein
MYTNEHVHTQEDAEEEEAMPDANAPEQECST